MNRVNEEQKKLNDFAEKYNLCVRDFIKVLEVLSPTTDTISNFDMTEELRHITGLSKEALRKLHIATDSLVEVSERLKRLLPLYLVGIDTDCCVLKTATDLFERGIRPIVLEHYCASNGGEDSHKAALRVMERTIGRNQIAYGEVDNISN